ncbi:MAG: hypothetical protein ACI84S_000891 [Thalassomonas sp.]|jgi:hypothetical protein
MGNLEKPLTWGLTILLLGYLFVANCKCGEESTCSLNNGFNISNAGLNGDVLKVDVPETIEEEISTTNAGFEDYLRKQGFSDREIELLTDTGPVKFPADVVIDSSLTVQDYIEKATEKE